MAAPSRDTASAEFQGDVVSAASAIRNRLGQIIESVCGAEPRASDVSDLFGVHRKLGWQLWNVAYSDDALASVRHLPAPKSLKLWQDAAAAKGVKPKLLAQLDDALALLDRSARTHAPDRETFEMLVESHASALDEEAVARWRKQSFTGNAFTWGVQAKCMYACGLLVPSERDGYVDLVRIQGLVGLTRTRPDVRWPFAQLLVRDGDKPTDPKRVPLDPSPAVDATGGVPLLQDFCSKPLPAMRRHRGAVATIEDELLPADVGTTGAATVFTGEIIRELFQHVIVPGQSATFGTGVRTPSELLVSDLVVHESLYPGAHRELLVFGELMTPLSRDERDLIPVPEKVEHLGPLSPAAATDAVPRYNDLLALALERLRRRPREFDLYRVRMRYPPIPTSVTIRHTLPTTPA